MFKHSHPRQAITTKYLGPTNILGSRIKATCEAGSVTVYWQHELDLFENHERAAYKLAAKFGWLDKNEFLGGALPRNGGYCFVAVGKEVLR